MATSKLQVYARLARGLGSASARSWYIDTSHLYVCVCILVKGLHGAFYACVRACTRAPSTLWNADRQMRAYTLRVRFLRCETCPRAPPPGSGKTAGLPLSFFFLVFHYARRDKGTLNWIFFGTGTNARARLNWAQVTLKFILPSCI